MSDFFDCIKFKKTRNDKVMAVKLGYAKKRDDGGFYVNLDAMPVPEEGVYGFVIVPQRERDDRQAAGDKLPERELDDAIPF